MTRALYVALGGIVAVTAMDVYSGTGSSTPATMTAIITFGAISVVLIIREILAQRRYVARPQ